MSSIIDNCDLSYNNNLEYLFYTHTRHTYSILLRLGEVGVVFLVISNQHGQPPELKDKKVHHKN